MKNLLEGLSDEKNEGHRSAPDVLFCGQPRSCTQITGHIRKLPHQNAPGIGYKKRGELPRAFFILQLLFPVVINVLYVVVVIEIFEKEIHFLYIFLV